MKSILFPMFCVFTIINSCTKPEQNLASQSVNSAQNVDEAKKIVDSHYLIWEEQYSKLCGSVHNLDNKQAFGNIMTDMKADVESMFHANNLSSQDQADVQQYIMSKINQNPDLKEIFETGNPNCWHLNK